MSQTENRIIDSETNVDIERIDIVSIGVDFLRVLKRMWLYAVVFALIGGMVMGFQANRSYQAYYTASATFTINIHSEQQGGIVGSTSFYDNEAAEQMALTFPHILTSGVLQRRVARELGVSAISGVIKATAVENTNLFTLSVRDKDPQKANETLQAVMNNYPSISEAIIGKVNMKLLDETGVPTNPDNPKDLKNSIAKGALAGVALSFVWMVLVVLSRRTIRREEDCPRYINKKCLGSIPYVRPKLRSKTVRKYINISEETTNEEFKEAIRIVRNRVERSAKENDLKVILVTSALAGEGKSTIAVNLAISLAQEGKHVALIDCDLRNPSDSVILNLETPIGLTDVLKKNAKLSECVRKVELNGARGTVNMLYLPVGKTVADGSHWLGNEMVEKIIESLKHKMDYVILDSAPVGLLTDASVLAQYADGAVFIVKKDFAKADYILKGMEHLAEGNVHMIGCVLNGD